MFGIMSLLRINSRTPVNSNNPLNRQLFAMFNVNGCLYFCVVKLRKRSNLLEMSVG